MDESSFSTSSDRLPERAAYLVRQDPTKAVATAFGFGFLLHLLPIFAIASMLFSLLFALVRPVFLFLGLLKAFELVQGRVSSSHSDHD